MTSLPVPQLETEVSVDRDRQTRAMWCLTPIVLYDRRQFITLSVHLLVTVDMQLRILNSRFWDKVQEGNTVISEDTRISVKHRINGGQ